MFDDFMLRALIAGLGLTLATGPLGSFVVWRRMAYFGDATSHAAILGVALAFAFHLPLYVGILAVAIAVALIVSTLAGRGHAMDTLLGVMAHSALAIGLVAVSFLHQVRVDGDRALVVDVCLGDRGAVDLAGHHRSHLAGPFGQTKTPQARGWRRELAGVPALPSVPAHAGPGGLLKGQFAKLAVLSDRRQPDRPWRPRPCQ